MIEDQQDPQPGGGKYGNALEVAARLALARCVVLIVQDGHSGPGFSVSGTAGFIRGLPALLRLLADDIEAAHARGLGRPPEDPAH